MNRMLATFAALAFSSLLATAASAATPAKSLGSPDFIPTAQTPIGWRGDGTGRFPGATPPTTFSRPLKAPGEYESTNIQWMARMPSYSISSPISVGDKLFLRTEMTGILCLNKADGKILWIRHNTYFDAATAEEKQANPDLVSEAEALAAQLQKLTDQLIGELNAGLSPRGMSAAQVKATDARADQYLKLERKLSDAGMKLKGIKNLPDKQHCGWANATLASDGRLLFAQDGTGVISAYTLDGKRLWSQQFKCGWEHGNHESPILVGDTLLALLNASTTGQLYAFDKTTGKVLWQSKATGGAAGSLLATKIGGTDIVLECTGQAFRVSDGKALFRVGNFPAAWPTPIIESGIVYDVVNAMHLGRYGQSDLVGTRLPAQATEGAACTKVFSTQLWEDKKQDQFKIFISSPLYHDGLIYAITEGAILFVADAATGQVLYKKTLDAEPLTGGYVATPGICASPTLAGQYIYILSDLGIVYVLEPGKEFKLVARNVLQNISTRPALELTRMGKQEQTLSTPIFEGPHIYLRGAEYVYCIGTGK